MNGIALQLKKSAREEVFEKMNEPYSQAEKVVLCIEELRHKGSFGKKM